MKDFRVHVETTEGDLWFQFSRLYTIRGAIYFVSVNGHSLTHYFHMEKNGGQWKISDTPKMPAWLYEYEGLLAETIAQNPEAEGV